MMEVNKVHFKRTYFSLEPILSKCDCFHVFVLEGSAGTGADTHSSDEQKWQQQSAQSALEWLNTSCFLSMCSCQCVNDVHVMRQPLKSVINTFKFAEFLVPSFIFFFWKTWSNINYIKFNLQPSHFIFFNEGNPSILTLKYLVFCNLWGNGCSCLVTNS